MSELKSYYILCSIFSNLLGWCNVDRHLLCYIMCLHVVWWIKKNNKSINIKKPCRLNVNVTVSRTFNKGRKFQNLFHTVLIELNQTGNRFFLKKQFCNQIVLNISIPLHALSNSRKKDKFVKHTTCQSNIYKIFEHICIMCWTLMYFINLTWTVRQKVMYD